MFFPPAIFKISVETAGKKKVPVISHKNNPIVYKVSRYG
jgi:hypothetical protein